MIYEIRCCTTALFGHSHGAFSKEYENFLNIFSLKFDLFFSHYRLYLRLYRIKVVRYHLDGQMEFSALLSIATVPPVFLSPIFLLHLIKLMCSGDC